MLIGLLGAEKVNTRALTAVWTPRAWIVIEKAKAPSTKSDSKQNEGKRCLFLKYTHTRIHINTHKHTHMHTYKRHVHRYTYRHTYSFPGPLELILETDRKLSGKRKHSRYTPLYIK